MSWRTPIGLALVTLLSASPVLAQQQTESLPEQALRGLLGGGQSANQEEEQIRQLLEERGYSNVGPVQRVYRTTAQRNGRDVAVTIDPQTGQVTADRGDRSQSNRSQQTRLRNEDDVRDLLNDEGYTRVTNIRRDGRDIRATAERDGQQVSVVIDSRSGWIEEVD